MEPRGGAVTQEKYSGAFVFHNNLFCLRRALPYGAALDNEKFLRPKQEFFSLRANQKCACGCEAVHTAMLEPKMLASFLLVHLKGG